MHLYLLQNPTYFGHTSWPSSGSYRFGRNVQRIWQLVMDDWQNIYMYSNINYNDKNNNNDNDNNNTKLTVTTKILTV
jgi:hypothetical protein